MQREHEGWATRNFGETFTTDGQFKGMVEEMGELAHAMLKREQGIRGMQVDHAAMAKIIDAHCDLIIFSLGLATLFEYDLETELNTVWDKVKRRDWVANPVDGT